MLHFKFLSSNKQTLLSTGPYLDVAIQCLLNVNVNGRQNNILCLQGREVIDTFDQCHSIKSSFTSETLHFKSPSISQALNGMLPS